MITDWSRDRPTMAVIRGFLRSATSRQAIDWHDRIALKFLVMLLCCAYLTISSMAPRDSKSFGTAIRLQSRESEMGVPFIDAQAQDTRTSFDQISSRASPIVELIPQVQSYDWGKLGKDGSKVAEYSKHLPDFQYDENKPYAELWMGTHTSLPSKLMDGKLLSDHLSSDPGQLMGKQISDQYGSQLPFLFKVLAIGKALSIQAHPDRQLAIKLHMERPNVYKDDNHKPEMAIAITRFSGFCGFRPLNQISKYLEDVPEFAAVIGKETTSRFLEIITSDLSQPFVASSTSTDHASVKKHQAVLKELFGKLMNASTESVTEQVQKLIKRIESGGGRDKPFGSDEELLLRLNDQFPDDVGIFCAFVLNVVQLEPGQAAFLQADEPHAYLTGDIVECMASSDNVVRAGLTPKLRDVPTLTEMLTYSYGPSASQLMKPTLFKSCQHTKLYDPPIEEFSVLLTKLSPGEQDQHPPINGPSILIVTQGSGTISTDGQEIAPKHEGQVYFIAAGTPVQISAKESTFVSYRAFVEGAGQT
ncbi:hypothetical protein MJO28_004705 [Puccinia striiformis f. sp. tritici]|uniref:Mannose-6-phosphate isomerase n=2 Tax=Puccinia striiformis TaxID=27350 RepID=A0A2S4V1Y4_9BASI|nr:hypothetical protein Pst134EB_009929 [Puccinia striiformis f. sp. tritici]KAI7954305.1 hypothetical protein MJO28_004705 [Puccinia striiformis f. sp. tritici]POW03518.1 hypothetical protein PSTT_11047 [Puccinia striiformis]